MQDQALTWDQLLHFRFLEFQRKVLTFTQLSASIQSFSILYSQIFAEIRIDPTLNSSRDLENALERGRMDGVSMSLDDLQVLKTLSSCISLSSKLIAELRQWEDGSTHHQLYADYRVRVLNNLRMFGEYEAEAAHHHVQTSVYYCSSYVTTEGWYRGYLTEGNLRVYHGVSVDEHGNRYEGQWDNDMRHGFGKEIKPVESSQSNEESPNTGYNEYEGSFYSGKRQGFGRETLSDGSSYAGQWADDKKNGYGQLRTSDKTVYKGEWKEGERHGYGVVRSKATGCQYKGMWRLNQREGFGLETDASGSRFEGYWHNHVKHGPGKLSYTNGFSFSGHWENGVKTGSWNPCVYSYKDIPAIVLLAVLLLAGICGYLFPQPAMNGDLYQRYGNGWYHGKMNDTVREGYGKYIWMNGDYYEGEWRNDTMSGRGLRVANNNTVSIGDFQNNQFVAGKVIDQSRRNDVFVGNVQNARRSGPGIHIKSREDIYFGNWTDDSLHGLLYSSNGSLYQGDFTDLKPVSGQMVKVLPSESLYIGSFVRLQQEGPGLYLNLSSPLDMYIGNWSQSKRSGLGIDIHGFNVSIGEFSNGMLRSGTQICKKTGFSFSYATINDWKKSGFGMEKERSALYIGSYTDGEASGRGLQVYESGQYLLGDFSHNRLVSGHGLILTAINKLWYYGGIQDGVFSGHGIQWNSTGFLYSGEWLMGIKHGKGVEISSNYDIRVGKFNQGELDNGTIFRRMNKTEFVFGVGTDRQGFTGFGGLYSDTSEQSIYFGEISHDRKEGAGLEIQPCSRLMKGSFRTGLLKIGFKYEKQANGVVLYGEVHDFARSGQGVTLFPNGTVVAGMWSGGKRKGQGLTLAITGEHSSGDFEGDVLVSGTTLQSLPNGDYYYGQSANGVIHGNGTRFHPSLYRPEFNLYMGEWQNGQESGRGTKVTPGSELKVGVFAEGEMTQGMDLNYFSNGDLYYGEKNDRKKKGWGCYVWSEGTVYIGKWDQGKMSGDGRLIMRSGEYQEGRFDKNVLSSGFTFQSTPSGDLYLGQVQNFVFSGKGTLLTLSADPASLNAYSGDWVDGMQYGAGLSLSTSVNVTRGQFQSNGFWSGKALFRYLNQDMYYGDIQDGEKEGFGVYIWENGTMYSGNWANDTTYGEGTKVTPAGSIHIGLFNASGLVTGHVLDMRAGRLIGSILLAVLWVGG